MQSIRKQDFIPFFQRIGKAVGAKKIPCHAGVAGQDIIMGMLAGLARPDDGGAIAGLDHIRMVTTGRSIQDGNGHAIIMNVQNGGHQIAAVVDNPAPWLQKNRNIVFVPKAVDRIHKGRKVIVRMV